MRTFFTAAALMFSTLALAEDPQPAPPDQTQKDPAAVAPVDCATLEGEAKTKCEADKAKAAEVAPVVPPTEATPAPAETPKKGSKAKRSGSNRMESETNDE